jgi:hypothetical protein
LLNRSDYEILDMAAIKAVKEAAPFYLFPTTLDRDKLTIHANFIYRPYSKSSLKLTQQQSILQSLNVLDKLATNVVIQATPKPKQSSSEPKNFSEIIDKLGSLGNKNGIRLLKKQ